MKPYCRTVRVDGWMGGWGTRGKEEWIKRGSKQLGYGEGVGADKNRDVSGYRLSLLDVALLRLRY